MTDDQTLRAVAEAATPGPWTYCAPDQDGSVYVDRAGDHGQSICMVMSPSPHDRDIADGKFISTFDPPTVLSLLDRLAAAEARATTARADGLREAAKIAERMYVKDAFRFEFGRDIATAIRERAASVGAGEMKS